MDTRRRTNQHLRYPGDVSFSPQRYRSGGASPHSRESQRPTKPAVVEPPKPTDSAVLKALTQLAEHVVMKDATIEKKIYDKNLKTRGGKRFRFLYEEESNDGKYYKWLKRKLTAQKTGREISPDLPASQNSRSPRSSDSTQNPPRKRKRRGFSATGPGGPSLPITPLSAPSGATIQPSMPSFRAPPPGNSAFSPGGSQMPDMKKRRKERERRTFTEEVKVQDFSVPVDEKTDVGKESSTSSLDKMEAFLKQMDMDNQRGVAQQTE